ncbi:MAG: hypothetical protein ACRCXT_01100 [Paraclostridium sp.]
MNIINRAFLNWYTQSLGGIIGILICIWSYLQGNMVVYGNILNRIDSIGFGEFFASYILLPLCILISILGAIESYSSNSSLSNINKCCILITIIIGFVGCKIYFIIPSIFILFRYYSKYIIPQKNKTLTTDDKNDYILREELESTKIRKVQLNESTYKELPKSINENIVIDEFTNDTHNKTRVDMAIDLLRKNADKNFICEITGLDINVIKAIEKENI